MTIRITSVLAMMPGLALAHTGEVPHVHGGEVLPLLAGLGLIAVAAGAAVVVKVRSK